MKRYRLNKKLFKSTVPRGSRTRKFELAGINSSDLGHYYNLYTFRDAERRNLLAANLGLKHNELWEEV
jgi:hypothetical protein